MGNVFPAASGYRDPLKAMTLKALEARAKAAAEASSTAMQPQQITSPWQGAAGMLDVVGARMNENRVNAAEVSGRQELANTMAGINMDTGPDMATIARVATRDPELAQHLYDQAMERKAKQEEMKFQSGEHALDRNQRSALQLESEEATARDNALGRKSQEGIAAGGWKSAEGINANTQTHEDTRTGLTIQGQKDINTNTQSHEDTRAQAGLDATRINQDDQQKATADLATQNANAAIALEREKAKLTPDSAIGKIIQDFDQSKSLLPGETQQSPAAIQRLNDAIAAENLKGTPAKPENTYAVTAAKEAATRHSKIVEGGRAAVPFKAQVNRLVEIGKTLDTSPKAAILQSLQPFASAVGITLADNQDQFQAFKSITDALAPAMRIEGSGPSSDMDVRMFLSSLPSVSKFPAANQIIEATLLAAQQNKIDAGIIASRGFLDPNEPNFLPWNKVDAQIAALPDPFAAANEQLAKLQAGGGGGGGDDDAAKAARKAARDAKYGTK
jgi:hypothetical protein